MLQSHGSITGRGSDFSLRSFVNPSTEAYTTCCSVGTEGSLTGLKRPERENNDSALSSADVCK
jgi:hypothetical protein